jgi:4-diphosphocytidyl-2-C-methyl-D-erythritol kinase
MDEITLSAYGKINLGLDVIGKRPNGYHDVSMIMQSVELCDTLTVKKRPGTSGIQLSSSLEELSNPEENLAVRATSLLMEEFHISDGLSIELTKRIPVAAGMAGGSTDAAAAFKAVNELFELGMDGNELARYGVRLGADIPYCLLSGTALSEGIGEILTPLPPAPDCFVLLVNPGIHVSTKYVYEHLDAVTNPKHPDIDGIRQAIEQNDYQTMVSLLENILETVTIPKAPVISKIKEQMLAYGADGSLMSGSGPTVFGLFSDETSCLNAAEHFLADEQAKKENWSVIRTQFHHIFA